MEQFIAITSIISPIIEKWEGGYVHMSRLHVAQRKTSRKYIMGKICRYMNDTQEAVLQVCFNRIKYRFPGLPEEFIKEEVMKQINKARKEVIFEVNTYNT